MTPLRWITFLMGLSILIWYLGMIVTFGVTLIILSLIEIDLFNIGGNGKKNKRTQSSERT